MKQVQGRLTSFGFCTTQGEWTFDISAITGAAAAQPTARATAQPQPAPPAQAPGACAANIGKNNSKPPSRSVQQSHAESSRARDLPQSDNDDDDDFMDPPPRRPVAKKQCTNASVAVNATGKPPKNPVKYAHAPTARCAPSIFNSFVDQLTFKQRRRIKDMGFGGLLCVSAERLESRELLKFLFDRLDPKTMVINVTKDKGIQVTPFAVKQVFDLPDSGKEILFHTHTQASKSLFSFKTSVGLDESQDLHASHLEKILHDDHQQGSGMIDDEMAIRFFFIIACNKLLFPSTDNNIRCKDVYLTRDLSSLPGLNWCKAIVDDLRQAALTWRVDKAKNSLSGCSILLIILYLDNLQCKHQIGHADTPRAKYFDQNVIKKIISADRSKDQQGKVRFGLLPPRNSTNTCYHVTQHPSSNVPPSIEPFSATQIPSMQAELHGLVAQIGNNRKTEARLALANFDVKAKKATSYMNIGQQILRDAHQTAIRTLQAILHEDHHDQHHASDAVQPGDINMYDRHSVENIGSGHLPDVPIIHSETRVADLPSGGHTNQEFNHGAPVRLQQIRNKEQVLPSNAIHNAYDDSFPQPNNAVFENRMDVELSPVRTQVHTDKTIGHVVPPVAANGDTVPDLPIGSDHDIADDATSSLVSLVDLITASTAGTSHPQVSAVNVVSRTDKQLPDEAPQNAAVSTSVLPLAATESTTHDALGPILLCPSTQNESLHHPAVCTRPQRLTRRPAMYVSPFKGDPQRAIVPMSKAHAVRKKFQAGIKCPREVFIRIGLKEFSGDDIVDSFLDNEALSTQFMSYFVACMSHDEFHTADGGGYRVFLSQELGEYVNIEEDEDFSQWESHQALTILERDLADLDPTKVKLFLLPVMEEEHYSIYCINFIHDRIDILDSSPEDMAEYHQVLGERIIKRLNLLFQLATDGTLKQFTRFKRPLIDACLQSHENDSGFLAIKFMELWNGDSFHVPIHPGNMRQYRSQLLFYGLYHQINEIKKLPAGLEPLRPRL